MARTFDGTANGWADYTLSGFTTHPYGTAVAVVNIGAFVGTGAGSVLFLGTSGTADTEDTLNIYGPQKAPGYWNSTANVDAVGATVMTLNNWLLVAVSKATGTVACRVHHYTWTTNTWVHENTALTSADSANVSAVAAVGGNQGTFAHTGQIAAVAVFNKRVLTDSEIERMACGRWNLWTPDLLVEYPSGRDFPAQTVAEHSRNRCVQSGVGSTVSRAAVADPPGFKFSALPRRR